MLIIFNLSWDNFDIDARAGAATRRMNGLAAEKGAGNHVIFNLASLGAGEWVTDAVKPKKEEERPAARTMDYLRRRHWRMLRDLNRDETVRAYRDSAEMLAILRRDGHRLAAVHTGPTGAAETQLQRARMLDYFEDAVYGYDRRPKGAWDLTARGLYMAALRDGKTPPHEAMVVADTPEAIEDARPLKPGVVAAYLNPYQGADSIGARLKEMKASGADYAVCGGHSIANLPDHVFGRRALQSTLDTVLRRLAPPGG